MYKCDNCGKHFDYPKEIITTYEDFVGVSSMFPTRTPMMVNVCPYCKSEDFSEEEDEDGKAKKRRYRRI